MSVIRHLMSDHDWGVRGGRGSLTEPILFLKALPDSLSLQESVEGKPSIYSFVEAGKDYILRLCKWMMGLLYLTPLQHPDQRDLHRIVEGTYKFPPGRRENNLHMCMCVGKAIIFCYGPNFSCKCCLAPPTFLDLWRSQTTKNSLVPMVTIAGVWPMKALV